MKVAVPLGEGEVEASHLLGVGVQVTHFKNNSNDPGYILEQVSCIFHKILVFFGGKSFRSCPFKAGRLLFGLLLL